MGSGMESKAKNQKRAILNNAEIEQDQEEENNYNAQIEDSLSDHDINDLSVDDAILAGNFMGIIQCLAPLFLNPFNTSEITKEHDRWINILDIFNTGPLIYSIINI
eukprot:523177_1